MEVDTRCNKIHSCSDRYCSLVTLLMLTFSHLFIHSFILAPFVHVFHTDHPDAQDDDCIVKDDHLEPILPSVDLAFENIQMVLQTKKNGKKQILDGSIHGRARPGRMLAIMGPSGAG